MSLLVGGDTDEQMILFAHTPTNKIKTSMERTRKMKKIIALMLITALLSSLFIGCTNNGQEKEYTTAIIGYSGYYISGLKKEYEIRDYEGFKGKKGPEKVTFNHKEKQITVSLSETEGKFFRNNYYPVYEYGDIAWFNPNGDLEYYYWDIPRLSELKRKCSEEEAIRVASEFVSEITDPDLYTVSVNDSEELKEYFVFFTKYVDGIKTTEELQVRVNYHGELYEYVADMVNQFSTDTKNPFDMYKVKKTVYERLNGFIEKVKYNYDRLEYKDEEFRLTKLKDGSLAIQYTVEVLFVTAIDEYEEMCSGVLIKMLVMQ